MVTKFEKPVGTEIGNLASLATTDKSSVVGAINSLNSNFAPSPVVASNIFTPNTGIEIHEDMYNYKIGEIAIITFSVSKTDKSVFDGSRIILGSLISGWIPQHACIVPISGNITADSYVSGSPGNLLLQSYNSNEMIDINQDATPCKQLQIHAVYRVA